MSATVVPTRATAKLAAAMVATARREGSGAEAVILHLDDLGADQYAALVGLLLEATRAPAKRGRSTAKRVDAEDRAFTEADAVKAWRAYRQGDRSEWVLMGARVYRRRSARRVRAKRNLFVVVEMGRAS